MFVTRLFLLLMAKTIKAFEPILCVYGYGDYNKIEDINLVDVVNENIYLRIVHVNKIDFCKLKFDVT